MSRYRWATNDATAGVELAERIEEWGRRLSPLGVGHFHIDAVSIVDETPGGPRAKATVRVSDAYDHAHFWFTHDFLESCTEDELDQTILHEWLHVAMRDFDESLQVVSRWMPEATYADFEDRVDHEREGLVDRVAHTLFLAFKQRSARFPS